MGRKKGKRQSDPSRDEAESTDSGDEGGEEQQQQQHNSCPHVGRAVQLNNIKKSLKFAWVRVGQCTACFKESQTKSGPVQKRVKTEVLRRELGGKLTLQEIKKQQLERAKEEQKKAAEALKRTQEVKPAAVEESQTIEHSETAIDSKPELVIGGGAEEVGVGGTAEEAGGPAEEAGGPAELPSTWLCMKCGTQGCGDSTKKHSYSHYTAPRSDLHCLIVNTASWTIWCYECKTEIYVDSHKKLYEAVEFVKKVQIKPSGSGHSAPVFSAGSGPAVKQTPARGARQSSSLKSKGVCPNDSQALARVKGLNNLGNTCFFNSVLQCLAQTHVLTQLVDLQAARGVSFSIPGSSLGPGTESESDTELNAHLPDVFSDLSVKLAEGGPVLLSLAAVFKEMLGGGKAAVVSPGHLFGQVVRQSPRFRGMQQQDSHELLRYLLDGLKHEEAKRQKTAILKYFGLTEKSDPKSVAQHLRKKLQAYGREAAHTLPDRIFSGQMVSTIVCEVCHHSSQTYEQFLDISLPVVEDKPSKPHKTNKKVSSLINSDEDADNSNVSCFGAKNENKKSKGQLKKERERRNKEKRANKKQAGKISSTFESKEVETKIREELEEIDSKPEEMYEVNNTNIEDTLDETEKKYEKRVEINEASRKVELGSVCAENCEDTAFDESVLKREISSPVEGEWDWDYGEPWEEKQQLVFKAKLREKIVVENNDETSDYLDASTTEEIPQKPEIVPTVPEDDATDVDVNAPTSSEVTGNNTEEEDCETGTSSNADIEDNDEMEDKKKWVMSKNLLNNLQKLDRLMDTTENVDPQMQEVCRGLSSLRTEERGSLAARQRVRAEWTGRTLTCLAPRCHTAPAECSLYSCLNNFTQSELLAGPNKWACEFCTSRRKLQLGPPDTSDCSSSGNNAGTVYSPASKQLLIFCPPAILTLHLKRFQQTMAGCKKVNKHVVFPLQLDLAAFTSSTAVAMPNVAIGQQRLLYTLYGVVEHSGRLQGGHYTAFVKVRPANNTRKDPTDFFSPSLSKASDIPKFLEEIEQKVMKRRSTATEDNVEDKTNSNVTQSEERKWFHVSDSSVSEVVEEKVLKAQAYLLFYERIL